jgi:hypothetical protein
MSSAKEKAWANRFLSYLTDRKIQNACLWTIAHSDDTDGWFNDDCEHFDYDKAKMLNATIWAVPNITIPTPPPPSANCDCKCPPVKPNSFRSRFS